jgi:hypothetical protein
MVKKVTGTFLLVLFLLGCDKKIQLSVTETIFEAGVSQGPLDSNELKEVSGMSESVTNPGLLWTHNDSGDEARILLIDSNAHLKAIVRFADTKQRDWEDMAVGPGPVEGKTYVYVGDIGDNDSKHKYKFIYRVEEPVIDWSKTPDTTLIHVDRIKFKLPDGPRDIETMMVDPLTRDIYLISKREQKVNLYRLPYPQSTTNEMTAELAMPKIEFNQFVEKEVSNKDGQVLTNGYHSDFFNQVVSGDISHDGNELLVKSYSSVYYWKREKNESIMDLLKRTPMRLPYSPEPQGEAIAFDVRGRGYYTISEERGKTPQLLFFYRRK